MPSRFFAPTVAAFAVIFTLPLFGAIGAEHPLPGTPLAAVATDSGFLIAWRNASESGSIDVTLLDRDGSPQKTTSLPDSGSDVTLASDGSNVLASWPLSSAPTTRRFAWLGSDGTPLGPQFDLPHVERVATGAGGGSFLLVWADDRVHARTLLPLSVEPSAATLVDAGNPDGGASVFVVSTFPKPTIVWAVDHFWVFWYRLVYNDRGGIICSPWFLCGGLSERHARALAASGAPLGPGVSLGFGETDASAPLSSGSVLVPWNGLLATLSTDGQLSTGPSIALLDNPAFANVRGTVIVAGERSRPHQSLYYVTFDEGLSAISPGMALLSDTAGSVQLVTDGSTTLALYSAPRDTTQSVTIARSVSAAPLPLFPAAPQTPAVSTVNVPITQFGPAATARVDWLPVDGARIYHIDFTAEDDPEQPIHQAIAGPDATSQVYPYLTSDTPYRVDFSIEDAFGIGPSSTTHFRTAVTTVAPRSADQLEATRVGGSVHLRWRDRSSNEEGFRIFTYLGGSAMTLVTTVPANTTEATVPFLASGQVFYVAAFIGAAEPYDFPSVIVGTERSRAARR